jgi:hypothetical protein
MTKGIEAADDVQMGNAWNAAIAETKELRKDLEPGSDEFMKHAAKRVEEIFRNSQSVYDLKDRSAMARSKNSAFRLMTMFTSQRNVIFNEMINSYLDWKQGERKPKDYARMIGRLLNTTLAASALMAFIEATWDALVKRKEPEEALKRFDTKEFMKQATGDVLGYSYLTGEAYDGVMKMIDKGPYGYTPNIPIVDTAKQGMTVAAETAKFIEQSQSGEFYKSGPYKWQAKSSISGKKALDAALDVTGRLSGLPYRNVKNLLQSAKSYISGE